VMMTVLMVERASMDQLKTVTKYDVDYIKRDIFLRVMTWLIRECGGKKSQVSPLFPTSFDRNNSMPISVAFSVFTPQITIMSTFLNHFLDLIRTKSKFI
jgi:hypothetical protein